MTSNPDTLVTEELRSELINAGVQFGYWTRKLPDTRRHVIEVWTEREVAKELLEKRGFSYDSYGEIWYMDEPKVLTHLPSPRRR